MCLAPLCFPFRFGDFPQTLGHGLGNSVRPMIIQTQHGTRPATATICFAGVPLCLS
jgi:hypothetical protein